MEPRQQAAKQRALERLQRIGGVVAERGQDVTEKDARVLWPHRERT